MSQGILENNKRLAEPLSTAADTILISVNPRAGSSSAFVKVRAVEQELAERGFQVEVTSQLEDVRRKANEWSEGGHLRAVVAAGGDGTASAVRNAIPQGVPMVPLPLGTECLLAKHIGQLADPHSVCETIINGLVVHLDAGRVNSRFFLLMISVGLDAEVVHRLQSQRTGHITHMSYVGPTLATIRDYRYPELRVYYSDAEDGSAELEPHSCRWLLAFNLPCYARGLPFAPEASGADGMLDLCAFEQGSLWSNLRYLWHVLRSRHHVLPDVALTRVRKFRIEAADDMPVAVQADGDRFGRLPVDVEVVPEGLTLLVSAAGARRLGFETKH